MGIVWTIIIGFVAGLVARMIVHGRGNPQGLILTALLGVVGAFAATEIGQWLDWYAAGQGAGFIGATFGAVPVLILWGMVTKKA